MAKIDKKSIVLDADSYKVSMHKQYPPGTKTVFSYISSRGGSEKTFNFGLQAFLRDVLTKVVTKEEVEFAKTFWNAHGEPFPYDEWMYIVDKHFGVLPLAVYGLDEGLLIPSKVPVVVIYNTDPKCYWLTTWVETPMLRAIWYPTTVATQSYEIQQIIKSYLDLSGDISGACFKLHDFGSRGTSSNESASLGAMAHLATGAQGTDTALGILAAHEFYDADIAKTAWSIPAAEHSVACSYGRNSD